MKRFVLAFLLLSLPFMAYTQIIKERRVYYLDCSFSMELNKDVVSGKPLWDLVRDNLKKAIDNVSDDETTELIVIPFAFNNLTSPRLSPIIYEATASGKAKIKSEIDKLPMNQNTMTYHYVPFEDFYNNRVADDRITYMFLMTDGQDEDSQHKFMNQLLPQWGSKYGNKNVFGFYVMLCNDAANLQIEQEIERQEHLWAVKTADVNINLIRLRDNLVFNKRYEKELEIRVEKGDLSSCPIEILETSCEDNCYSINILSCENEKIVAKIQPKNDSIKLPEETMMTLRLKPVSPSRENGFSCLVNDKICIKCKDKKERVLNKIRFE